MSRLALITFLSGPEAVDPGFGQPAPPNYPSQGLPGGPNYPSNALPGGGHISTLPVYPFDPTIDNSLPGQPPPHVSTGPIVPGKKFVVKYLACVGLILVPDNSLPEPTPEPK